MILSNINIYVNILRYIYNICFYIWSTSLKHFIEALPRNVNICLRH